MKKTALLILTLTLISCSNVQKTEFSNEALSAKLVTVDRSNISFSSLVEKHKGKILLIEVWASWCGDCVKAMPKIQELKTNHPDVDYMFISMDKTDDQWKEGIAKYDLKGEHFMAKDQMKGVFAKAIDLDWIPRYIIINKAGNIVLYRATETDFDQINTTLNKLKKIEIN
jgi:thiol-disulfide isomerase/thioredoxin